MLHNTNQNVDEFGSPIFSPPPAPSAKPAPLLSSPPPVYKDPVRPDIAAPEAVKATASTYAPTTRTVGSNELVENRLTGLLAKDNPYMQRAETKGLQFANNRGLLNSSVAAQASQAAAIDAALPIAQQDAGTYTQTGLANMNAANRAADTAAQMETQVSATNARAENALLDTGYRGEIDAQNTSILGEVNFNQGQTNFLNDMALTDKKFGNDIALADTNSASARERGGGTAVSGLTSNYNQNVAAILTGSLGEAEKTAAISTATETFNAGLQLIGDIWGQDYNDPGVSVESITQTTDTSDTDNTTAPTGNNDVTFVPGQGFVQPSGSTAPPGQRWDSVVGTYIRQ